MMLANAVEETVGVELISMNGLVIFNIGHTCMKQSYNIIYQLHETTDLIILVMNLCFVVWILIFVKIDRPWAVK